jgi:threonine dehydrogenase-like Zn-dependent dehydrogenase
MKALAKTERSPVLWLEDVLIAGVGPIGIVAAAVARPMGTAVVALNVKNGRTLRCAPYIPESSITQRVPRDLLLEPQHFDLASDVVPDLPQLDYLDPILLLWDTHD